MLLYIILLIFKEKNIVFSYPLFKIFLRIIAKLFWGSIFNKKGFQNIQKMKLLQRV